MDYTYEGNEIGFAKYLMINPPQKIWWNFTSYVFDYSDFYFQIECVSKIADTQNKSDEAIIGQFTKYLETYIPGQYTNLVCENKKIEKLYIVRVFLYFTTLKEYSKLEKLYKQAKQKIKTFLTGKKDVLANIISQSIECSQEITCHPKSDEAKNIDAKYWLVSRVSIVLGLCPNNPSRIAVSVA